MPTLGLIFTPPVFIIWQHQPFLTYARGELKVSKELVDPSSPIITVGKKDGESLAGWTALGYFALTKRKNAILHKVRSVLSCSELHC